MARHLFSKLTSPLALLVLLIAAPLILLAMVFKRLRGVVDEPTPIGRYELIPPANPRP